MPTPHWYQIFRDFGGGVTFILPLTYQETLLIILGAHLPLAVKTYYLGKLAVCWKLHCYGGRQVMWMNYLGANRCFIFHQMQVASGRSQCIRRFSLRDGSLLRRKGIGRCNLLIRVGESEDTLRSLSFSLFSPGRYYSKRENSCKLPPAPKAATFSFTSWPWRKAEIFFPAGNSKLSCVILVAHT